MSATELAAALWSGLQARDWVGARALFHDDATLHWATSGEHFGDADAIIRVQQIYPEGWTIVVQRIDAIEGDAAHALVEVRQPPQRFFCHSRLQAESGRIRYITEHWSTAEAPPAWRTAAAIGAWRFEPSEIRT